LKQADDGKNDNKKVEFKPRYPKGHARSKEIFVGYVIRVKKV
jgi:hypothetical protein